LGSDSSADKPRQPQSLLSKMKESHKRLVIGIWISPQFKGKCILSSSSSIFSLELGFLLMQT